MRLVVINDNCLFRGEGRGDSTGDRGVHGGGMSIMCGAKVGRGRRNKQG